jgi:adenosylhomocysteine nucleosidase
MARVGIISAMPVELEGIIERFEAKEATVKGFYKLFEGVFSGHEVYLACSGIGKVNAAACTQRLIDCYNVDYVINMGIAGGIDRQLKTLDVVIGTEVFYHDFTPPELLDRYYPFTGVFKCDDRLVSLAEKACAACPEAVNYHKGLVATGDCFVEAKATKDRIMASHGICCEMEGAAIGHVCHNNGVPFVVIRSISDLADEGAKISYEEFESKAAMQANRIVEGMIKLI